MDAKVLWRKPSDPLGLPFITLVIIVIFVLDTVSNLEIAVAVLYVAVIVLSARRFSSHGILIVAGVCGIATVVSFVLTARGDAVSGLINTALSLVAVAATTALSIAIQRTSQSERRTRDALAGAAQAASLGELVGTIARKIDQPLGAIRADANAARRWLSSDPPPIDRVNEALAAIVTDAHRAGDIVRRIRGLAAGKRSEWERLSLNSLVEKTVSLLRDDLARTGASLVVELTDELPSVIGNKLQLQQVLLNLLANAAAATAVATEGASGAIVIRSSRPSADVVEVAVEDSGPGVPASISDALFEAFNSTKVEGMGLGLAISRTLIEAHGGQIWHEPSPRGATFKFRLPIAPLHAYPPQNNAQVLAHKAPDDLI